jgi:zinc transport system substrate-binding protein
MLLKPGAEMHAYEPTPQDIIAIRNADLFIYVGGESDVWVEEILSSMPESNVKTIKLMDMVPTLNEELVEGMQADHDHDHEEGEEAHEDEDHDHEEGEEAHEDEDHDHEEGDEAHEDEDHDHEEGEEAHEDEDHDHEEGEEEVELDEHVWTAPLNAAAMVTGIAAELAALAPAHAEAFTANAAAYVQQLTELDAAFREVVKTAKRTELIFGDRFAMRYFTHAYGLTYYAAFPGCSGETEPSAQTVAFLMNKVKEDKVPVVLYPELSTHRVADVISEETGVPSRLFYACHNLTADEFAEGKTYVDFMTANLAVLKEALN